MRKTKIYMFERLVALAITLKLNVSFVKRVLDYFKEIVFAIRDLLTIMSVYHALKTARLVN